MFRWLFRSVGPQAPMDAEAIRWIHDRLAWLSNEFGSDRLIGSPIIEPTDSFFPDRYDGTPQSATAMFHRVCGMMDVSIDLVDLCFYDQKHRPHLVNESGHYLPGTAGTYQQGKERFVINLNRSELERPMDLVGTIAHELSHLRLLGESRVDRKSFDNELITDLTATFFGFGIFLANSPRAWRSQIGKWPGTELNRPEYMSLPMLAYALAVIADLRFEENATWSRHLNGSSHSEFHAARSYLRFKDRARRE